MKLNLKVVKKNNEGEYIELVAEDVPYDKVVEVREYMIRQMHIKEIPTITAKSMNNEIKQQDIIAEETSIESVTKRNLNLKRPTPFPAIRKTVYNSIDNKQYKEYTKENLHFRINPKDIIKQVMPQKLKNTIKKTLKK